MNEIDRYLDRVCGGLRGSASLRGHIRGELREHLLAAVESRRAAGATEDEAVAQAIEDFGEVIKRNPKAVDALCNRGNAYFQQNRPELALKDYDAAMEINPKDPDLYYNKAVVLLAVKGKEAAMDDFKKAAEMGHTRAQEYLKSSQT